MNGARTGYPYEMGAEDPFRMPPPVVPPCPLCSGKVDRDDPAAQALDWGVRVAEAEEGASAFWKVMTAAEHYQTSGTQDAAIDAVIAGQFGELGLESAASTGAVTDSGEDPGRGGHERPWVAGAEVHGEALTGVLGLDALTSVPALTSPLLVGALVDWLEPLIEALRYRLEEEQRAVKIIPDEWFTTQSDIACCVDKFDYPLTLEFESGWRWIGFRFTMSALYDDIRPCACNCCYFRQFAKFDITKEIVPALLTTSSSSNGAFIEDCVVVDSSNEAQGSTPEGDRVEHSGDWYDCYPRRWYDNRPHRRGRQLGGCYWNDDDSVRVYTAPLYQVKASYEYLGVIYDTCNNWAIRAIKSFRVNLAGAPPFVGGNWRSTPPP